MWEEDLCDFTEVTIGLWRLQHALRELRPVFLAGTNGEFANPRQGPRILLVPLPGEQHSFGLSMVFEFFCRAGWLASCGAVASSGELATMVRRESFAVVGLSVATMDRLETVASEIRAVRRASRNPDIGVMVGGPAFVDHPEFAALVGADATAIDGRQAVFQAQGLLTLFSGRR
jgi:methanogenic corrinoid protein MtbC1